MSEVESRLFKKYGKVINGRCNYHLYTKKQLSREEGIRTLDTLLTHTRFPSVRLKPLGHLSIYLSSLKISFELS